MDIFKQPVAMRFWTALIGAVAGWYAWHSIQTADAWLQEDHLYAARTFIVGGFFWVLLAVTGPLEPKRALLAAAIVAIPAGGLLFWASLRFENTAQFFNEPFSFVAYLALIFVACAYVIVTLRGDQGENARDYPSLFTQAWRIVVRLASALLFVAVFWGVLGLSDALLEFVGIGFIERLTENDGLIGLILTGAVFGLGLAVVNEMESLISHTVFVRFLRLLVVPVSIVVSVFLVAGLLQTGVPGPDVVSSATVLLGIALVVSLLVSSAVDQDNESAVRSVYMRMGTQLLSLLLPVVAGMALWAVYLRVDQFGWTPGRVAAASAAVLALGYGVLYALSVLRGRGWMARIRQSNIMMGGVAIFMFVAWLTPALDPERISTNSQISRFETGKVALEDLDLWEIQYNWGRAGAKGIERLKTLDHPQQAALDVRLAAVQKAVDKRLFLESGSAGVDDQGPMTGPEKLAELQRIMPVFQTDGEMPVRAWDALGQDAVLVQSCKFETPAGNPGCAVFVTELSSDRDGPELVIVRYSPVDGNTNITIQGWGGQNYRFIAGQTLSAGALDAMLDGQYVVGPSSIQSLYVDGQEIWIK